METAFVSAGSDPANRIVTLFASPDATLRASNLEEKNNHTFRRFLRNHQGSLTNFSNTFQIQSQVTRRLLTEGFRNLTAKTALGKSTTNFSNRDNSDFAESKFRLDLFILQYKQKALTSKIRKESAL